MSKQERITIDEHGIKKLLDDIGYEDLKLLRKESERKLSNIRRRDRVFFTIYLTKEHVEGFVKACDWAYEKGLIKKRTRWAFTRFCITNIISMILNEITKEQAAAAQQQQGMSLFPYEHDGDVGQS